MGMEERAMERVSHKRQPREIHEEPEASRGCFAKRHDLQDLKKNKTFFYLFLLRVLKISAGATTV